MEEVLKPQNDTSPLSINDALMLISPDNHLARAALFAESLQNATDKGSAMFVYVSYLAKRELAQLEEADRPGDIRDALGKVQDPQTRLILARAWLGAHPDLINQKPYKAIQQMIKQGNLT